MATSHFCCVATNSPPACVICVNGEVTAGVGKREYTTLTTCRYLTLSLSENKPCGTLWTQFKATQPSLSSLVPPDKNTLNSRSMKAWSKETSMRSCSSCVFPSSTNTISSLRPRSNVTHRGICKGCFRHSRVKSRGNTCRVRKPVAKG